MTHTTLGPVDAIWLQHDSADNLMVIEALVRLEGTLDRDRLLDVLQHRLVDRYPVFSQRPVGPRLPGLLPRWRDVGDFDVADHVHEARLPAPADDRALQRYVEGFLGTPLRTDRPLWEVHLVEGGERGTAVFVRLHHALADGIALTRVLVSVTDETPDGDLRGVPATSAPSPATRSSRASTTASSNPPVRRAATGAAWLARGLPVLPKLLLTRTPRTVLTGRVGPRKRVVWARPLGLDQVKAIARASGTTVNDVLVSALAGAVQHYQEQHGGTARDVVTMVPVNLRPLDRPLPARLGNRFAVVVLRLPSAHRDAGVRLAETKRRMDRIKASPEPLITFGLLHGIGRLGQRLGDLAVRFFAAKAVGVTTNVPGPTEPRWLAGSRVESLLGWVPGSGHQSLGTCVLTYAGQVLIGFKVDADVVGDPEMLLDGFHAEVDLLAARHGVAAEGADGAGQSGQSGQSGLSVAGGTAPAGVMARS